MNKIFILNNIKKDLEKVEDFLVDYVDFPHKDLKESSLHTLKAGGKRIRPAFVLLAGKLFGNKDTDSLIPFAASVELIHMASLIHDDVIDKAETRRGKPTVRAVWGNGFSLHAGDYIFAKAIKLVKPEKNHRIANILAKTSVEMSKGEIAQLKSFFDTKQSVRNYFYRIKRKTALLISASCEIGALASFAPLKEARALYKFGHYLGMAFQIKDDILDMEATSKTLGKPAGSDLAQGVITLPTIFALREKTSEVDYLEKLINDNFSGGQADIDCAIEIIKNTGGIERAKEVSSKYIDKAKKELKLLPKGSVRSSLEKLADYIIERKY